MSGKASVDIPIGTLSARESNEFPQLETKNLILRAATLSDAEAIYQVFADDEVTEYHNSESPTSIEQIKGLINRWSERFSKKQGIRWGIAKKNDNVFEDIDIARYSLTEADRRPMVMRQIRERRGQSQFRQALCLRYGDQCMITGCKLLDVVEAAHISPYRGSEDNHPANGLLLRTDLHTLFDLDLLGIEPESLQIKLHSKVLSTTYKNLDGKQLKCSKVKPSQEALISRWSQFLKGLKSDN